MISVWLLENPPASSFDDVITKKKSSDFNKVAKSMLRSRDSLQSLHESSHAPHIRPTHRRHLRSDILPAATPMPLS
jgi:hypothetical protein